MLLVIIKINYLSPGKKNVAVLYSIELKSADATIELTTGLAVKQEEKDQRSYFGNFIPLADSNKKALYF